MKRLSIILALLMSVALFGAKAKAPAKKKSVSKAITYQCSFDNSKQSALVLFAKTTDKPRPLFVVLHTWSGGCGQGERYAKLLVKHDVHMIAPHFRGPNTKGNKLAMGSDAAVQDVLDAVKYMQKNCKVDDSRIYLIGGSGGGFMSLLTSARSREIWAGVSSWCPISDLVAWHAYKPGKGYSMHIQRTIGDPRKDPKAKAEALHRSPVTYLEGVNFPLDITHGILDPVVPVSHALRAFNKAANPEDRFPEADIDFINKNKKLPAGYPVIKEKLAGRKIYLRRVSGNVRITVFHSGHTIIPGMGISWLLKQQKGKPADFSNTGNVGKVNTLSR